MWFCVPTLLIWVVSQTRFRHRTPLECGFYQRLGAINIPLLLRNSQVQAFRENNKRSIEQVRKGGLPPPFPEYVDWGPAGVNHPS